MTTAMTFDEYDNMVVTDENSEVRTVSFIDNMNILEDALEQIVPKPLEDIRKDYDNKLDEYYEKGLYGKEIWSNLYLSYYVKRIKELVQKNWDAVYAIVADDLK